MSELIVDEIWIYPVKSCRGTQLVSGTITARGLAGDREWLIVDEHDRFLTQRTLPQLATIVPSISANELCMIAPERSALVVPRSPALLGGAMRRVRIWNDEVEAMDAGDAAASWLRGVLGVSARLVLATPQTQRSPDVRWRGTIAAPVSFPDAFPILVCNRASLDDLNARLPSAIPMTRFRPNIVISGLPAYAEDELFGLRFGDIELRLVKPCTRCSTTIVDQVTGVLGVNPLPALKSYRFDRELLGITFGQNAVIASGIGKELRGGRAIAVSRPLAGAPAA